MFKRGDFAMLRSGSPLFMILDNRDDIVTLRYFAPEKDIRLRTNAFLNVKYMVCHSYLPMKV